MTPAVRAIERAGVAFELLEYDYDPAAEEIGVHAAQSLGRSPSTVFKTLVVALDSDELVCAIIPADARLNLKAIAAAAGVRKAELADPRKAERATGMWSAASVPSASASDYARTSMQPHRSSMRSS